MSKKVDLETIASQSTYLADLTKMVEDTQKIDLVILVEAKPDERFYGKFFLDNCTFVSCSGKEKVLESLQKRETDNSSHTIAIVDADFDRITGKNEGVDRLFFADFHDKEILILECQQVWADLLQELGDREKIKSFETQKPCKTAILEAACEIAYYKLYNEQEASIQLTFNSGKQGKPNYLKYDKFVDKKTLSILEKELQQQIGIKSGNQWLFKNNPQHLAAIQAIKAKNYPILELCNGHDVVNILALALQGTLGPTAKDKRRTEKEITTIASVAYRLTDFQTTQLYQALQNHFEAQNYPSPLKTA